MATKTSAGTTLKVSASQPGTFDVTGYNALGSFVLVGEITNFGEFGRAYNLVTHNPVGNRATVKKKGSFNDGALTLQLGLDTKDTGQILLKSAVNSDNDYSCLITTQNGDKYYFQAQVLSFKVNVGGVDQITAASVQVEITATSSGVGVVESIAP